MSESRGRTLVTRFCGQCSCGCPELHIDHDADPDRRVVITDDFGQRIEMSLVQLADLMAQVRSGRLDDVVAARTEPEPGAERAEPEPGAARRASLAS